MDVFQCTRCRLFSPLAGTPSNLKGLSKSIVISQISVGTRQLGRSRDTSSRAVGFVPTEQKTKWRFKQVYNGPGQSLRSPQDSVGFSESQKGKMYGFEGLYIIDFAIQAGVQRCRVISCVVYDSVGGSDPQERKKQRSGEFMGDAVCCSVRQCESVKLGDWNHENFHLYHTQARHETIDYCVNTSCF